MKDVLLENRHGPNEGVMITTAADAAEPPMRLLPSPNSRATGGAFDAELKRNARDFVGEDET
jgi:hypothetical protein